MLARSFVVIVGAATLAGCCFTDPRVSTSEPAASGELLVPSIPTRCAMIGKEQTLGRSDSRDQDLDKVLPFATEMGGAVAFDNGFAAGALRQQGVGTAGVVVTASKDGSAWQVITMADSHGDAEAPRVFARGSALGAAMLEPAGARRALRLARINDGAIQWAAELPQGVDESMAYDVGLGDKRGIAVWDDMPKDRDVSAIMRSTFDPVTFEKPSQPSALTLMGTDAESPRIAVRPGGFWLFWTARRPAAKDHDAQYRAEDIDYRWLEVVPLDDAGELSGTPRRVSDRDGHVLAYDVMPTADGAALVVWRDDDTPSGSAGGQLMKATVRLGGLDGPDPMAQEHAGVGAPTLMQGWFSIADALGPTRLAPMAADGRLLDALRSEALIGVGEPLANHGNNLLIARPSGVAVRLFVSQCQAGPIDAGVAEASPADDAEP